MIKVKVCCIASIEEAQMAKDAGADWLGLVSHMPSGPGVISNDQIQAIIKDVQLPCHTVLLTSETGFDAIVEQHRQLPADLIQFVDYVDLETLKSLRQDLSDTRFIQVVHVTDASSLALAKSYEPLVDYILLDSGNPFATTKTLGGTGQVHDWDLSAEIVNRSLKPVFLAGGLNANNVSSAIAKVSPHGVDLCSGVRTNGKLDQTKLLDFMSHVM